MSLDPDEVVAAALSTLEDGDVTVRILGRHRVLLYRRGDGVFATEELCPHRGASLSAGSIRDDIVTCVAHLFRYDLTTGRSLDGGRDLRTYPVRLEGERVIVTLPSTRADGDRSAIP